MEPTSLNRGEGLVTGLTSEVGGREVVEERWWRWWRRRERRNINRDAVDVKLKLHSRLKIAFDMNTLKVDNKIKNCIVL